MSTEAPTQATFVFPAEPNPLAFIRLKPDSLPDVAWGQGLTYDPLERLVR